MPETKVYEMIRVEISFCQIKDCKGTKEASLAPGIVVLVAIICFVGGLLGFSLCQKYAGKSTITPPRNKLLCPKNLYFCPRSGLTMST